MPPRLVVRSPRSAVARASNTWFDAEQVRRVVLERYLPTVRRRVGQHGMVYIGVSHDALNLRATKHDEEKDLPNTEVLGSWPTARQARTAERLLIRNVRSWAGLRCMNIGDGGEGVRGRGPFEVYASWRRMSRLELIRLLREEIEMLTLRLVRR